MKKILKYLPFLLSAVGILMTCQHANNNQDKYKDSREIYDRSIEVHDEVMPKMGKIMELQKSLKEIRDQLNDEHQKIELDSAINRLEGAHDGMMKWMRNIPKIPPFNPNGTEEDSWDENYPDPEELEKLERQSLEQIKKVKENIDKSIEEGEKLLNTLKAS